MPPIPSELLREKVDGVWIGEGSPNQDLSYVLMDDFKDIVSKLEKEAIAETEKPKLVWVEERHGIAAHYNKKLSFYINGLGMYVTVFSNGVKFHSLGNFKTEDLAKQACEQFLTDLITPTPNDQHNV